MRTQKEILERIKEIEEHDFFGFQIENLIIRLNFKNAKPWLKNDAKESDWEVKSSDPEDIKTEMLDYMSFAWDKANNFRGLSASRSMDHYTSWVWLMGDNDVKDIGNLQDYEFYGKDNLCRICEYYDWDANQWDDGVRLNEEPEVDY